MIGIVKEIYIPNETNNGRNISYLDSKKVGFKLIVEEKEVNIVVNQNNDNALIHVGDEVLIERINNQDNYFVSKVE